MINGPWCNGNATPFEGVVIGSIPIGPVKIKRKKV